MEIYDLNPEFETAKKRALRILERMPRTKKQLRDKLVGDKRYSDEIIDMVIAYVEEYHYIDDRQYAVDYINNRKLTKGIRVLLYELRNKGIEEDILDELKEEFSDMDSTEAIRNLIRKKGIDPNNEDRKQRERLYRFLLSKGFSYSDISSVFSNIEEEY